MSLLDAYSSDLETRANDLAQRPMEPQAQAPRFSLWDTIAAAPRGLAAGAQDVLASTADVLGAFGSVAGAVDARPGGMFSVPSGDAKQQMDDAAKQLREQGPDYRAGVGLPLRQWAEATMPDPQTSHAAEQAVAELFRVGGKAIGSALVAGPVAGAAIAAVEEGFTTAEKLAEQGVDVATRTGVGAVTAAVQAVTFALPVAGKTAGKTAALALGGGPVAFMGQQAAIREILQNADYSKLAERYDPFDPVGLTLSTIIPLGFGAIAMRAARAKGALEPNAVPTAKTPIADAVHSMGRVTDDAVDAARVTLVRETVDSWNLGNPADIAAANSHLLALSRASDQIGSGMRVDVSDLLPPEVLSNAKALDVMIERMEAQRIDLMAEAAGRAEPGAIQALRQELEELQGRVPDTSDSAVRSLAKTIQEQERISYKQAHAKAQKQLQGQLKDVQASMARVEDAIDRNAAAQQSQDVLNLLDRDLGKLRSERQAIDAPPTTLKPTAAAAKEAGQFEADAAPPTKPATVEQQQPAKAALEGATAREASAAELTSLQARAEDVEAMNPDLPVMLEGMDAPAPLREVMERIRAEVAQDLDDLPLLEVAAACALRN